jgi:hypothetical protein
MPYRDGTGPLGEGPKTGWGRGDCADDNVRNERGFGFGFGFGRGRGRRFGAGRGFGLGRGFGWGWNSQNQDEESYLKSSIDLLKNQLKNLEDRLGRLKNRD